MPIYRSHDEPKGQCCLDRGWASQHDRGGDGGSARGREEGAREGTQGGDGRGKEEEACVFPKNMHGVIKKTVPTITTMVTATPTVTPNLTLEELVKFMDAAVASKYRNDLTNFTHTIT
jgi:hypothetical protein